MFRAPSLYLAQESTKMGGVPRAEPGFWNPSCWGLCVCVWPSPSHCTLLSPWCCCSAPLSGTDPGQEPGRCRRAGEGGSRQGFYRHWRCKDLLSLVRTRFFRMTIIQSGNREESQRELMGRESRK